MTLLLVATPRDGRLLRAEEVFVDITKKAGIAFDHTNGARGEKVLVETMGGGAGWIDADGDGRLDLYLVNGHGDSRGAAGPGEQKNRLFRNLGDGTFQDVTDEAGVGDRGYGFGLAVGDIDNDGDSDLYVTNYGRNTLYLSQGDGTFRDVTESSGTGSRLWSASAAFADIDGDGFLDLYIANYLVYDARTEEPCNNPQQVQSYCHPNKFDGAPDTLYRNRGDGTFEDISRSAGVTVAGRAIAKGLGVLPTDYDLDGDLDFFVANDSVPNFLWRNLGGRRFEDAALEAGVSHNTIGKPEACMGIDGGDVNGDGFPDYYVTNFSEETDSLFLSEGDGFYEDATYRAGLAEVTYLPLGFGTGFIDYDLDGDLDIYVARGHLDDVVERLDPGRLIFAQPDQLLQNDGKARFRDVSASSGRWFREKHVGRAAAFADHDSDGDLDLFVVNLGTPSVLLENRSADRERGAWIGLDLAGGGRSNRDAYGSRVTVATPGGDRVFEVRSAASYLSANDPRLLIGLGDSRAPISRVTVRWPDGAPETFEGLATGRYHRLEQGRGSPIR